MGGGAHPDRATIRVAQLEQLRALVAELIPANPFYSRKLQAAGAGFDVASLDDFSGRFPFTTKPEIVADQQAHPPYGTNLTYPINRYTRLHHTSGTSGAPLRWLDTQEGWEWMLESWTEVFVAAGVTARERVFFAFSFGPFIGFWLAFESAQRLGCLCLPGGGMRSDVRVKAIIENSVTVLCCTPTYALRLGEVLEGSGRVKESRVKIIIVAGEPGGSIPATRQRIAALWPGARVFDHHGMTEVGPVTYECPAEPGVLHVIESAYYAEVIDPATGCPATAGELVLTTLGRAGSPLLRYRTGDLVKLRFPDPAAGSSPCRCGRHELALEGGVLGRVDDMVIVRGVNVYPSAIEEILRGFSEVTEYSVHVTNGSGLAEIRVEIEPATACPEPDRLGGAVADALAMALALRVPVTVVPPGSLPRFEMKARRWHVA